MLRAGHGSKTGAFPRCSPAAPTPPPSWLLLLNKPNGVAATDGAKTFIFLAFGEVRGGNGR